MSSAPGPLVSIATPVYNGEAHLAECIESVLAQTYRNLDYVIVDNCSTDGSGEIAERYARQDRRVRVERCTEFLGIIENHNRALRLVSPGSTYCKIVAADDWLYPEFLERTVALAEANPSVGIVGSYQLSGGEAARWRVRWTGLPYARRVVPGREICRTTLLGGLYVFGVPTSTLYRTSLARSGGDYFPVGRLDADVCSFYERLRDVDYGFVHQVLSFERIRDSAVTAGRRRINTYCTDALRTLLDYGPSYLTPAELERRREELLDDFYELVAAGVVNLRNREFWRYQKSAIERLGYPLVGLRLARAVAGKILDLFLNPKQTADKLLRRARGEVSLADGFGD